jgi:hypothetical protein
MADNIELDAGSGGAKVAADELTYSGDTAKIQLCRIMHVTGSEGSKSYHEIIKAEDAAHSSGDYGMMLLAVRQDTAAALAGTDGDYVPLITDANGRLHTLDQNSAAILADTANMDTNLGTIAGAVAGTEMQVDIVADGAGLATDAKLDDIIGDTGDIPNVIGTDGSAGPTKTVSVGGTEAGGNIQEVRVDSDGHLQVDAASTVTVDATGQGDVPITLDGESVTLGASDGTDIGDVDVASMPNDTFVAEDGALGKGVLLQGDDGTDRHNVAVDTSGLVQCDLAADSSGGIEVVQDTAGDLNVTEANSGDIKTAVEAIDDVVQTEDAAHSGGDKGIMPLGVRNDDLAALAGADGDYAPLQVDEDGALYVTNAPSQVKRTSGVAAGGAPGADNMIAAVADRKIRVLAMSLFATSTTANNIYVDNADNDLMFNSGNPLPMSLDADGDTVPAFVLQYNPGGWFETDTVNEALTLNTSAAQDIAYSVTYVEVPA